MESIKQTARGSRELFRIIRQEPGILFASIFITVLLSLVAVVAYYATLTLTGLALYLFANPVTLVMLIVGMPFLIRKYRRKQTQD